MTSITKLQFSRLNRSYIHMSHNRLTRRVCCSVVNRRASGRQHRGSVSVNGGLACVNSGLTNLPQRQRWEK